MPRLSYPQATKGNAIYALLKLYRNDPDFIKGLEEIRKPYMVLLDRFSIDVLAFFIAEDTPSNLPKALFEYGIGKSEDNPLPPEQFYQLFPYFDQFQPYFDGLNNFAYEWKLRARWAVHMLFILDIFDCWKAKGMPSEFDIPLEKLDSLFVWEAPAPPLTITVSAWAVVVFGRGVVLKELASRLIQYENEIKAAGLKEYPSALNKHAQWWFEHYVKEKSYAQLEKTFPEAGQESIKRKVWEFSKLVGIKTR